MRDFLLNQKSIQLIVSVLLATSIELLAGCSDNTGGVIVQVAEELQLHQLPRRL